MATGSERRAGGPRRAGRDGAAGVAVACVLLLLVGRAGAKLCGDNVDGRDVACACGDILVSDLAIDDDPIAGTICSDNGLIVRAREGARGLTVDLRGRALRGAGAGTGVRVVAGGAGGARIVSSGGPAEIGGFKDGIAARGWNTLSLVENVVIAGSRRDGLRVTSTGFTIRRTEVRGAGRDGFSLSGRAFQILDTRAAESGRFGYFVMGQFGTIGRTGEGNVAERSGTAGFNVMGAAHYVTDCVARAGRKDGVKLHAMQLDVRGCRAEDNAGDGIFGLGSHWRLAGNVAANNGGDGIAVRGSALTDEGGNRGEGNRGESPHRPAIQCAISGTPCSL